MNANTTAASPSVTRPVGTSTWSKYTGTTLKVRANDQKPQRTPRIHALKHSLHGPPKQLKSTAECDRSPAALTYAFMQINLNES